jgi:hypothetical protein
MTMGFTIFGFVTLFLGLLMFAARTGPVEAKLNLSTWAEQLGVRWLLSKQFGLLLAMCGLVFSLAVPLPKFIAGTARLEIVGWHFFPPGEPRGANWAANDIFGVIAICTQTPPKGNSTIEPSSADLSVNICTQNKSNFLVISDLRHNYLFKYFERPLSRDEENTFMRTVGVVFDSSHDTIRGGNEISPQDGFYFTLVGDQVTPDRWDNVLSGKALVYLFIEIQYSVMSYTRVTERCFFLNKDYPSVHSCLDHNQIFTK